jgi:chromosomal replication initiation ATPase DnaA
MPAPARQLALDLALPESLAREDFLEAGSNAAALRLIERWPDWSSPALVLVGPEGAGKTHLASIWARNAGARILSAHALAVAHLPTALATGALVVEDLAPGAFDERALFHLLNLAREETAYLLFTARSQPAGWVFSVADAASRMRVLPVTLLHGADDALMRAIIVKLFADRQLQVDEPLVEFMIARIERTVTAAKQAVARLDAEALTRGRAVNRALAAEMLRNPLSNP